jgi:putative ABC transport system permease protein
MIWSIAWKNVWRNKKRSLIVIIAVMLGTSAGVFTSGLMIGWVNQRIRTLVHTEIGHLKIHNPDYLKNEEIGLTIADAGTVSHYLDSLPAVAGYSKRVKVMAMASTSRGNTALVLQGVSVQQEKSISTLYTEIIPGAGTYLNEAAINPIVISDKTAEQLKIKSYQLTPDRIDSLRSSNVPETVLQKLSGLESERINTSNLFKKKVGQLLNKQEISKYGAIIMNTAVHYRLRSKIICTLTDVHGVLVSQAFKVCGVYKTSNTVFDAGNAFVLKPELAQLTGLSAEDCHEIGILLKEEKKLKPVQNGLKTQFPTLSIMNWLEISPEAGMLTKYMDMYYYILMGVILFALAFGIINTMLMAILERTKELGMLMAIGMNRKRVFYMIMLETIFLTLVGALAGMGIGWLVIQITGHTGLDFSVVGEGFEAMGWSAIVYPAISASFFFGITLLVFLTGILSSIIPARKALSLNPVEAIRTSN